MAIDFKAWLGEASTIVGSSGLVGIIGSVAVGTITWQHAVPLVVAAIASIIWRENPAASTDSAKLATDIVAAAPTLELDVNTLLGVFKQGMQHQVAVSTPTVPTPST